MRIEKIRIHRFIKAMEFIYDLDLILPYYPDDSSDKPVLEVLHCKKNY
jgi:hypothetical protein